MTQGVHVAVFALAALACFLAIPRVRGISHAETRYGLYGLLITTGLWAVGQMVLFFDVPLLVARVSYQFGLVAGLATVGAWLYFCSAYTSQTYHREPRYRLGALGAFFAVVALKLTNPIHGRYFAVERVTTPFSHVSVELLELHFAVTILAYSLTAVGFYMLFELFTGSDIRTTRLTALVSLTALPVALDLLGLLGVPGLVAVNYEPLGVAAFAVGTLYVAEETFEQVRWTSHRQILDNINEGIVVVDENRTVRDFNAAARRLFPQLTSGQTLGIAPDERASDRGPGDALGNDSHGLLPVELGGETRYYMINETDLTVGPHLVGRALVVTDVTKVERQRRELRRQSEQLDGFAAAVAHELRNTLAIAEGNLALLSETVDAGETERANALVEKISEANGRMTDIVGDLSTLARLSQTVRDPSPIQFAETVERAYATIDTGGLALSVEGDGRLRADETRLSELVRNATHLAVETDASELVVALTDGALRLRIDGGSVAREDVDGLFEYGTPIPHGEAGMFGPNIQTLARAHGWEVSAVTDDQSGIRIEITGITVDPNG